MVTDSWSSSVSATFRYLGQAIVSRKCCYTLKIWIQTILFAIIVIKKCKAGQANMFNLCEHLVKQVINLKIVHAMFESLKVKSPVLWPETTFMNSWTLQGQGIGNFIDIFR